MTRYAKQHEAEFAHLVMEHTAQSNADERQSKKNELYKLTARDRELDKVFNRLYEDNINGKIDDDRFAKMSTQYTDEQKELADKIKALTSEIDAQEGKAMTADMFISTVRKYTRAKKLTERMLNELIERVEVYQSEKVNGVHQQRIRIHYNCVGAIEIPASFELPEISMKTRKGVTVVYIPYRRRTGQEIKECMERMERVKQKALERLQLCNAG